LGSAIANSDQVEYLREPVLQTRIPQVPDPFCASAGLTDAQREDLRELIERTFASSGRPVLVVKEPTPLLVSDYIDIADPEIIYLHRHPLAVATSHLARGWTPRESMIGRAGISPTARLALEELWNSDSDLIRRVGYFGAVDASIAPALREDSAISVRYEDLVRGDLGQLAGLFTDLGLSSGALRSPAIDAERTDAFGVGEARTTTPKPELSAEQVAEARKAWMMFDTDTYRSPGSWEPFISRGPGWRSVVSRGRSRATAIWRSRSGQPRAR
jgi:hypothetical protein